MSESISVIREKLNQVTSEHDPFFLAVHAR